MLIESVPNVSEGRRLDVVDRMAEAIEGVEGVYLLDRTSDASHNRSVFTLAGEHEAVADALERLVAVAIHEIDMDIHTGEHPRIGAVDVIPFVPLGTTTIDDCVELGARVRRADRDALLDPGLPVRPGRHPARTGQARRRAARPVRGPQARDRRPRARAGLRSRRGSTRRPGPSPSAPGRS